LGNTPLPRQKLKVCFSSKTLLKGHVNYLVWEYLLAKKPIANKGLNVKRNIEKFFFEGAPQTKAEAFLNWLESSDSRTDGEEALKNFL